MFDGFLKTFVYEYRWIHLIIGLTGNVFFIIGSSLFLFESSQQTGTWFFLAGSIGMLLGRIGEAIAHGIDNHWRRLKHRHQESKREAGLEQR